MLLLLWRSRSTLLTCHIAVVFCFCSSLQQGLTSAFLSVAAALWAEVGIVASSHHWQWWFIIFQLFCLSLPILFDSVFIFCVYFNMEGSFCKKEHNMVCESLSSPTPGWGRYLISCYVPSHLQICLLFRNPASPCVRALCIPCECTCSMTLGMDGISLVFLSAVIVCSCSCAFRLNWIILFWFLRDTILIL